MTHEVIRLDKPAKTFGKGKNLVHVVKDISLICEEAHVYGFLGLNGVCLQNLAQVAQQRLQGDTL